MHGLAETFANSSGTNELPAATPAAALSRLSFTADSEHDPAAAEEEAGRLAEAAGDTPPASGPVGAARDPHAATANVPPASAATAIERGLPIECLPAAARRRIRSCYDGATAGRVTCGATPSQAPAPVRPGRTALTVMVTLDARAQVCVAYCR